VMFSADSSIERQHSGRGERRAGGDDQDAA
jgi:hypothetical protein